MHSLGARAVIVRRVNTANGDGTVRTTRRRSVGRSEKNYQIIFQPLRGNVRAQPPAPDVRPGRVLNKRGFYDKNPPPTTGPCSRVVCKHNSTLNRNSLTAVDAHTITVSPGTRVTHYVNFVEPSTFRPSTGGGKRVTRRCVSISTCVRT